ncbi:hypothetical protein H0O00_01580 [Candidatus Micrarchaeota archaeon]|nr:hypothetical protein [Candidatus Micrarchaeota archaeon]
MRESTVTVIVAVLFVIFLALTIYALVSLGTRLIDIFSSTNFSAITLPSITLPQLNITPQNVSGADINLTEEPTVEQMPEDMRKYYDMKNLSCATLEGDFLIVTDDFSQGKFYGIVPDTPEERAAAQSLLAPFDFNQTTKTYLRGERMKKVVMNSSGQKTTIWKDGRIYNCASNCTMHVFTEEDAEAYYSMLDSMRVGCAYFGRTKLPDSVDMGRLIQIDRIGPMEINGFGCQDFLISGNKTYADAILVSTTLTEDQEALLWGLSRMRGPVEECLDEATGIIVLRKLTLDLTGIYRFNYAPGGYMQAEQETKLTYFTDNVPESFLALPS